MNRRILERSVPQRPEGTSVQAPVFELKPGWVLSALQAWELDLREMCNSILLQTEAWLSTAENPLQMNQIHVRPECGSQYEECRNEYNPFVGPHRKTELRGKKSPKDGGQETYAYRKAKILCIIDSKSNRKEGYQQANPEQTGNAKD